MRAKAAFLLPRENIFPPQNSRWTSPCVLLSNLNHTLTARPITAKGKDQFLFHDQS